MNEWDNILAIDLDLTLVQEKKYGEFYSDLLPIEGAAESLKKLKADGWKIMIYTARGMGSQNGNLEAIKELVLPGIKEWLDKWEIPYDIIEVGKPLFWRVIDDRAIKFTTWQEVLTQI